MVVVVWTHIRGLFPWMGPALITTTMRPWPHQHAYTRARSHSNAVVHALFPRASNVHTLPLFPTTSCRYYSNEVIGRRDFTSASVASLVPARASPLITPATASGKPAYRVVHPRWHIDSTAGLKRAAIVSLAPSSPLCTAFSSMWFTTLSMPG